MEDAAQIKAEIKKLNAQATQLKMDLHDLAEDLPTGWDRIPDIANKTYRAYENLDTARKRLAATTT